ncbi:MAG: TonB-dependent receptor [Proteobacteria bacterium]|nr:TonB-dependent receptor [Pseudomonadota bacterium]
MNAHPGRFRLVSVFMLAAVLGPGQALAQEGEHGAPAQAGAAGDAPAADPASDAPGEDAPDEEVEQIDVRGMIRHPRAPVDAATPMDSIPVGELLDQPSTDMTTMLRTVVPSFNVNTQPISDAATMIRPANLRGLPPDNTIVLVNGKRRHRGSVITFQGFGVADGAQGADISAIPSIALERIEVLRDGAAAQYGADAIAGVMNFMLKQADHGTSFETRLGQFYAGDGLSWSVSGNVGLPLTDNGFANLSIEYGNSDPTSRSVQRDDAIALINPPQGSQYPANASVRTPAAQIWGAPRVRHNLKLFANTGYELAPDVNAYLFGNFARRDVLGGFYFRNPGGMRMNDSGQLVPMGRKGVFVKQVPVIDPVTGMQMLDPMGNPVLQTQHLVGPTMPGATCAPVVVGDAIGLQQAIADPNCFVFNERHPGGFTPQFGGDVLDWSLATGVRGELDFGMQWDASVTAGQNAANFLIRDTVNASLGPDSPNEFNPGRYSQFDVTVNLDMVYPLALAALAKPLSIAGGLEYRREQFSVRAGDPQSYEIGPYFEHGFSVGSNGFPGFGEDQAGTFDRQNVAAYLDLEADPMPNWQAGLAGRVEYFDTFGSTANIKAATRYDVMDLLAVRGAIGTGFRAPTPGQANITNVSTVGGPGGALVNRATIPPTNPVAVGFGGQELQPETSLNFGAGLVLDTGRRMPVGVKLTADYYNITVKDRISQSATQNLTPDLVNQLVSTWPSAKDWGELRFYTNAFNTRTQGLDVVGTVKLPATEVGNTDLILAYNWNQTKLTDRKSEQIINDDRKLELEESLPKHRFVVTANHVYGPFRLLARANYYGSYMYPAGADDFKRKAYAPRVLVDLEASMAFLERFRGVIGVQNLLNTFPEEYPGMGIIGSRYPENAPTGFGGGFWYVKLLGQL